MLMTTHDETKNVSLPPSAPLTPSTPHELHAGGLMSAARVASLVGLEAKTIGNRIYDGRIPSRPVAGSRRVEPLVAWAYRWGVRAADLREVADFLTKNKASPTLVDDCIKLIESLIARAAEDVTPISRGRRSKSLEGPPEPSVA